MATNSTLVLSWEPKGRQARAVLEAKVDEQTVYLDKVNLLREQDREKVLKSLSSKYSGIDAEEIKAKLLELAVKNQANIERAATAKAALKVSRGSGPKLNVVRSEDRGEQESPTDGPPRSQRPDIEISTEWHEARDKAIEALCTDEDLYNRGGQIVTIAKETKDETDVSKLIKLQGLSGSPKIVAVSEANIGCALTKVAAFFRWKPTRDGELVAVSVGPTNQLVKSVATMGFWPGMRWLDAVAECPFPKYDGSLVETPGYDPETRTFYAPSIDFLPVPENPTHNDAIEAWLRISRVVCDFPFATEDDKVVYLAGLLTIIARPAIEGAVPGIAVIGNKAGTGKGLLIDAMVIPGTGRICPTSTYPETTEEATKVKVSIAKAAKVAVHFDNLENGGTYGGSTDSPLTTLETDERQLNTNEAPVLKLRTAWFLSGNNLSPAKDAHRRWLVCRLKTDRENPEDRTDFEEMNHRQSVMAQRPEIVRDVLTILRAHMIAGLPTPKWAGFGSFEDWDRVVRGAVWYATGRDCRTTQKETEADSLERNENLALLEGFSELPGSKRNERGVTSEKAIKLVEADPDRYQTLRSSLMSRGRAGKMADSRQLGNLLRAMADTPVGGFKLVRHPILQRHAVAWIVDRPDQSEGESGESGESSLSSGLQNFISDKDAIKYAIDAKCVLVGAATDSPDSPDSPSDEHHGDSYEDDLPAF